MADTKYSALTPVVTLSGAEEFGVNQAGTSLKTTTGAMMAGGYFVRGLVGQNDATTPNTKYGYSADLVQLRNPTNGKVLVKTNTGLFTNDTGLAGPATNGRDVVGAFASSIWIHFYWICKDDGTLGTISSAVAPPTGPTLPATYTHWAYAGAVFYNATPLLVKMRTRGAQVTWDATETDSVALNAGTATVETAVSLANFVPPNALAIGLLTAANTSAMTLRQVSGGGTLQTTVQGVGRQYVLCSNVSQQVFYLMGAGASQGFIWVNYFRIPNGGE